LEPAGQNKPGDVGCGLFISLKEKKFKEEKTKNEKRRGGGDVDAPYERRSEGYVSRK